MRLTLILNGSIATATVAVLIVLVLNPLDGFLTSIAVLFLVFTLGVSAAQCVKCFKERKDAVNNDDT